MSETESETMFFNGVDGSTGEYEIPPMQAEQFTSLLTGGDVFIDPDAESLRNWYEQYIKSGHYGLKEGCDPKKLEESGWGILFARDADPAVVEALRPLMDFRKSQAGTLYREYTDQRSSYNPDDTKNGWLVRQGGTPGPVEPTIVPYYLLIVGGPDVIPYRFQTQLDVQYAVGRIAFDTVEEYARYAQSVVAAETQQIRLPRKMTMFGVANRDDPATRLSSEHLIAPLPDLLANNPLSKDWQIETITADAATKARLGQVLGGSETPALLFTASHGMGFPKGDPRQRAHQGALLCQDWPGPRQWRQPVPQDFYFAGDDLRADANLFGTIAFFFACYGAGTPMLDEFAQQAFKNQRAQIADRPFLSSLPQRMLSHPRGGALAAVGHVERAWGHSFFWGRNRSLTTFESAFGALMDGFPVGYAFEVFNERYAEISTELTDILNEVQFGLNIEPLELAGKWTANNDSKNYVILGDPAVRVMAAKPGEQPAAERPSIAINGKPAAPRETKPKKPAKQPVDQPTEPTEKPDSSFAADGTARVTAAEGGPQVRVVVEVNGQTLALRSAAQTGAGGESFGIIEDIQGTAANLGRTMQEFVQKLGDFLGKTIDNAATLQVRTLTSESMEAGKTDPPADARLRALTTIKILGDVEQIVPVSDGVVDVDLWNIHLEMVKQAQTSRTELVRAAVSAASNLIQLGGIK